MTERGVLLNDLVFGVNVRYDLELVSNFNHVSQPLSLICKYGG